MDWGCDTSFPTFYPRLLAKSPLIEHHRTYHTWFVLWKNGWFASHAATTRIEHDKSNGMGYPIFTETYKGMYLWYMVYAVLFAHIDLDAIWTSNSWKGMVVLPARWSLKRRMFGVEQPQLGISPIQRGCFWYTACCIRDERGAAHVPHRPVASTYQLGFPRCIGHTLWGPLVSTLSCW